MHMGILVEKAVTCEVPALLQVLKLAGQGPATPLIRKDGNPVLPVLPSSRQPFKLGFS